MASGLFLGFYHNQVSTDIPKTHFHFEIEFYKNTDWNWLQHAAVGQGSFTARSACRRAPRTASTTAPSSCPGIGQQSVVPVR